MIVVVLPEKVKSCPQRTYVGIRIRNSASTSCEPEMPVSHMPAEHLQRQFENLKVDCLNTIDI